jgi:hypothetical protein
MAFVDARTGEVIPETWKEAAEMLDVSRPYIYKMRDALGLDGPEYTAANCFSELSECRDFTKQRVGGDRVHTIQNYLRSKGHGVGI